MKTCKTCGVAKELSAYSSYRRGSKTYLFSYCKPCYAERCRTISGRARVLVGSARSRSKKLGLPFDLTVEWAAEKLTTGLCEYSGLRLTLETKGGRRHPRSPSIDRIDPSGGYTKANCRIACLQANIALLNFGQASMDELVEARARTISSQASQEEGSTTRAKARRVKRPEAPDALDKGAMI